MSYNADDLVTVRQAKLLAERIRYNKLATPTLTLGDTNINLIVSNSGTVTFTTDSDGVISVSSSDDTIATASVNNGIITINSLAAGSAVITLSIAASNTYKPISDTINVIVSAKTIPTLTPSDTDIEVTEGSDGTVTVTTDSDGAISVSSDDGTIATAAVSGNKITITGVAQGSTSITVSLAETATYAARNAVIDVTVEARPADLEEYTWAQIQAIGAAGTGANYFDVGDTKTITLNGTVGTLALDNFSCKVFILDFNYRGDNGIYFGGFKTSTGVDIALCDSKYGSNSTDGTKYFNMNHWGNYNYGGWKGCDLRYDILGSTDKAPSDYGKTHTTSCVGYDATSAAITSPVANTLMAALPSDLRAALAAWTVYTDNYGNSSDTAAHVTASIDYLPLLSEFEVQGARTYANDYEKNSQAQMAYYANGNSKIKYKHNDTVSACSWWVRSAFYLDTNHFCSVSTDGSAYSSNAYHSRGLVPAFRLA